MTFSIKAEDKNRPGIYGITSLFDSRLYVGSTKNFRKRYREHNQQLQNKKHSSQKLQRFYNKYGKGHLSFAIIEKCDIELLSKREQYWIDLLGSYIKGFNCNPVSGGLIGLKRTKKWNKNISKANKGKILSEEHKAKLSVAGKNRKDDIASYLPKNQRGSLHPRSKLNENQILEIRRKYKYREYSYAKLADEYFVSKRTIIFIIKRKTWRHV